MLGESVRGAIYYHIERTFHIRREQIPKRLEAFHEALQGMLGEGAMVVERLIAKNLYAKLGLQFEQHGAGLWLTMLTTLGRSRGIKRNEKEKGLNSVQGCF